MPKIVDHDEYRKQLVKESFELMAKKGYASLSMRDLARALRISPGTLYHYFPNKLGLFEAILKYHAVGGGSPQVATEPQSTSFEEGLNEIIAGCEQSEEMWAKILFMHVDAYREADGKMLSTFNSIFTSTATRSRLAKQLKIEDPEIIDLFRVIILGTIIQRVLSKRNLKWSTQKRLLFDIFSKYADNPSDTGQAK